MLNAASPIPLYHQLADILLERIRSGEYRPGQAIPSETALAAQYGIGRPTVRQAMDTLVQKGLILRKRGAGTFVRPPANVDLFSLAGTSQAFLTKGIAVETDIVTPMKLKAVDNSPGNPFQNRQAFFFSRVTRAGRHPVLVEDIFLDPDLFRGIDQVDLTTQSLSRIVADRYYLILQSGTQTFRVDRPTPALAGLLDLEPDDCLLTVFRELDFSGSPKAIYSVLYCRTDRFAFSQTIGGSHDPR